MNNQSLTGTPVSFLSIQLTYTTQPFGITGASDIQLIHASLTHYRHYLQTQLNKRQSNEQREAEEERTQIASLNDMLFDMQTALINADQQRVRQLIDLIGRDD